MGKGEEGADRGIEDKKERKRGAERPEREKNKVLWSGIGSTNHPACHG